MLLSRPVNVFIGHAYHIEVKTANVYGKFDGTDGEVYIYINGSTRSSGRLVLQGEFEEDQLDRNNTFLLMNLGEVGSTCTSKHILNTYLIPHSNELCVESCRAKLVEISYKIGI